MLAARDSIRRSLRYFDITSLVVTVLIALLGLVFVWSATYKPEAPFSLFFKKQTIGILTGFIWYFIFACIDYRTTLRAGYLAYYLLIGILVFTLIKGSIGMGGQRWIDLGLFKFQPSEIAKVLFPVYAVYTLQTHQLYPPLPQMVFVPILSMLSISCILIARQPDLGTALLVLFSGLLLCWLAGLSNKFFIWCGFLSLLCIPIAQKILKPYQLKRISVFLGYGETNKERYQIEQAGIAIGSGGMYGKGLLEGTQNKFNFLPESRTDFIFAVLCEEWDLIFQGMHHYYRIALILSATACRGAHYSHGACNDYQHLHGARLAARSGNTAPTHELWHLTPVDYTHQPRLVSKYCTPAHLFAAVPSGLRRNNHAIMSDVASCEVGSASA
jgi:rod shape determining protein RodA